MATIKTPQLEVLRESLGEPVKDIKINLTNILSSDFLDEEQIWGIALASSFYIGDTRLKEALLADAKSASLSLDIVEDAQAAAGLMGMNTVYYRFRHLVGKESYAKRPARLRMQWMLKPKTTKANFELFSLAIAALAGCENCIKAHESSILREGLTEDHVHDAVRIAAVLQGAAVGLSV
jgi:alkyl hydroperoxide reductase subunit D